MLATSQTTQATINTREYWGQCCSGNRYKRYKIAGTDAVIPLEFTQIQHGAEPSRNGSAPVTTGLIDWLSYR
jgi:hypothetical protein